MSRTPDHPRYLAGDIFIQREGFTFYAPITTGILVSVVLVMMAEARRVA
jgi:hypothetical protein